MSALELAVRRAIEAAELRAGEIAAHLGCSRGFVSRVRSRMRREMKARSELARIS